MRSHSDMESETVRRNVKKRAAFGGMYVPILWLRCNVRVAGHGQAGDESGNIRHHCATHLPRLPDFTTKNAQADSGINFLAQHGGDMCVGIVLESRISMSLMLDVHVLKLLIL
jgi:hypothetical protein